MGAGPLSEELGFGDGVAVGAADGVGKGENFDENHAVNGVDVVDVDLLGVGLEGGVDVLVDEGEDVRLLHGDHVVGIDGLRGIGAPELLVEAQELARRADLLLRHGVEVLALRALEREPHGEREEVAEGERRLVERLTEHFGEVRGEGRLRALEALEGFVELSAGFFVVLREALPDAL